jgi:hypothetical protein
MKVGDLVKLHEWTFYPNHIGTVVEILPEDAAQSNSSIAVHERVVKSIWTSAPESDCMMRVLVNGEIKIIMEHDCLKVIE